MMDLRQVAFHDHRNATFIILAAVTSAFAVRPDSTILPLVAALSVLLVYSPFLFRADKSRTRNVLLTWMALSVGTPLSRINASLDALSTPGGSLAALFLSSGALSIITLTALFFGTRYQGRSSLSSWSQITIFPTLWATTWCTVSYINPVGHLATWSAANNEDAYKWLVPLVGPTSKDWIIAAWGIVASQTVGNWYIGSRDDALDYNRERRPHDNMPATRALTLILISLTIPSFILPDLPTPASWSTLDLSTPLTVGCVLPTHTRYQHHVLTLDDYITESQLIRSSARVILWPEGAVAFHSTQEREDAFAKVRKAINGSYVGVSFEETISDPSDPTERTSLTRTGLAVISQYSDVPHHIYYKRSLVPFAESFRLRHSDLPPSVFELKLPKPKSISNRSIPITSSICLDFAQPFPFSELESRPALILAPARTWDGTVGHAMWLQAKQRAEEMGSMVLWCDGGEGGVSGVAGAGYNDVFQVGQGSFFRTIGIQYPFNDQRTPFARFGDSVLLLFWFSVYGFAVLLTPMSIANTFIGRGARSSTSFIYQRGLLPVVHYIHERRGTVRQNAATQPNLVDL